MVRKYVSFILVFFFTIILTGCNLSSMTKGTKNKQIDLGIVEINSYKNSFFNMNLTAPKEYVITIPQGQKPLADGSQPKLSDLNSLCLITIFKDFQLDQSTNNASFCIIAEKISSLKKVKKSSDYLKTLKAGLIALKFSFPYSFNKDIYYQKIGKRNFSVLDAVASDKTNNIEIHQKDFACIINGYVLSFISTSGDKEGDKTINQIINSISIK
ncbi:MAG TPA: hypothetical protein VIK72_06415 [Clostridiaceae bacterium]